jgi:glucose uptake protein GlcU
MPKGFRPLGIILSIFGIILLILKHQFNYKPDFLNLKVFALYSFYIEAKRFTMITHQMIEDIAGILLITGMFMIAFSREKVENEIMDAIRLKAFFITVWFNFFYLLFATLFFFGFGFVAALIFFAIGWLIVYIVSFQWMLYKSKS